MGVDAADSTTPAVPRVVVTNFSGEMLGLYRAAPRRPATSIARRARTSAGPRVRRSAGAASSSTSISTVSRICWSSTVISTRRAARGASAGAIRRVAASVPESRRAGFRDVARATRRGVRAAEGGTRRRVRRHRRGRRPRRRDHDQRRPGVSVSATTSRTVIAACGCGCAASTSNRDAIGALVTRRRSAGVTSSRAGEDRIELSVAVGIADHVRRRLGGEGRRRHDRLAERQARRPGRARRRSEYTVTEGKGVAGKRVLERHAGRGSMHPCTRRGR